MLFICPYFHFLNPIEYIFSVWKNLVLTAEAKSENELEFPITSKLNVIGCEHCDSFYRNMLSYVCMSEEKK